MPRNAAMAFCIDPSWLASIPLERAHALPAPLYTNADVSVREQREIFARSWQLVAHAAQLRHPGDHIIAEIAGVPLVLVRGDDHVLRAVHNVCRHRAGPLATCDGQGLRVLRCKYHGWTYRLDGQLRSAPEMDDCAGFNVDDIRLPQAQISEWNGLAFAALDPFASLAETMAGIDERLGNVNLHDYTFSHRVAYDIACNWKVYVDNFLEGYHLPHIHPALNRLLDYRSYIVELARWHSLQHSPLENIDTFYGKGEALYYFVWPNTMLNILPQRLQTNRVIPLDAQHCRVEFDYYYPHDTDLRARDQAFSDEIQREDIEICEHVQRGLASGSYHAGRLNPRRENGVHHFHQLYRTALRQAGD